ncbi:50S ribosomal protein L16 [candidate division WWE3 bacterium RIFOXYC1_FULL_40_10]|uniref:Large ribosomal subunit protein uL16 n=1 Tax=candidate division WWE3 bacterium RIFOXYA2_FULL_46_9 TaxID=1802636 RepID=A0A1F4VYY6_UNCKA|nr:MAG: 50S ribosomal protein L16 [candidate division WWE3 bacterium RIFOXYB1_FULL_40_22]OGC61862.1 MAG: 50S ribosomal protein L16 [candidate division WWE3 bacterium RIFOXYA1_FULL_40_11]OGC62228.1 MAG: 50S ribosomal protein L16 [candidate division WWE3 bacterium RIFOXYA2_FULL_46_9]OGC64334.1 MAG: 50S ribosomal protein L16 [candidate division WWE3 bacterium RIFOXYB2_FULL_41_6]OGC66245.1 MAG: 50S ribosomal protein L16 [candidate division WWE3 bacterium RIFOXYC1_FULL_40_10]OGC67851.1 MAG: 50S rib
MLLPKKVKFRKQQRGNNRGIAVRGSTISFGEYAIKSIERGLLTSRQLEAARKQIVHETKRGGKIWIRVFPDKPIAKKPPETRMGSGKAPTDHYAAVIKPGKVLFEMSGVTDEIARRALGKAAAKLPLRTKFIIKA